MGSGFGSVASKYQEENREGTSFELGVGDDFFFPVSSGWIGFDFLLTIVADFSFAVIRCEFDGSGLQIAILALCENS